MTTLNYIIKEKILLSSFFFLFSLFSYSNELKNNRLNVVWISCEDMGPILGTYGVEEISTPNIDKLASEGIKYTNAYSTRGNHTKSFRDKLCTISY